MTKQPGYRGLRNTTNREALLQAASDLIGVNGFSDVSIDEIVHHAGVAKGTFYNHFSDKADIAHHVALAVRYEIRDQVAALKINSPDPAVHISIAMTLFMQFAVSNPKKAKVLATMLTNASNVGAKMNERLFAVLEMGQAQKRFTLKNTATGVRFVAGVTVSGIYSIFENNQPSNVSDMMDDLIVHTLIGLGLEQEDASRTAKAAHCITLRTGT